MRDSPSLRSSTPISDSSLPSSSAPRAPKQPKLKRFFDSLDPVDNDKLDELLAEFFFACNVPFSTCDSVYFKRLLAALRPAYKPPNRKKLVESLLPKVNNKIEGQKKDFAKKMDKEATLLIDGWTNSSSNQQNVVAMLSTANDEKIFLESFDISENRETSEKLVEIVKECADLSKEKYDTEIYAVVTDNAANMTCMGSQIKPDMMFTTCNSHTGNLLAKDVIAARKYATIMSKVMTVQKDFKKPGLEARLKQIGGKKPVLYSVIRFASTRNAVQSFLDNLPFMKRIAADDDEQGDVDAEKKPAPAVSQLLFNNTFIDSVKNLLSLLDPIAKLINLCQKSDSSIADAAEAWLDLLNEAPPELKPFVESRCNKSNVFNDVTLAANYLHPVYRGSKMNASQRNQVDEYIFNSLDASALESFRLFTMESGAFAALKNKNITSPKTYWFFASRQKHPELASFATKILKIPASTAQLERLFSNWSFIHSEIRNRLSTEHSKQLLNIYFSLRVADEYPNDEIEDF